MLLELRDLRLSIGNASILRGVDLALEEGEIYGLLGPNGAGKSTTISAALGLRRPDSGKIRMFGQCASGDHPELRRRVGVLPEQNGFHDWMTAADYLAFFARLYGREAPARDIAGRLGAVGLAPRPGQPVGTFSRGMRQRLGLARALIGNPDLLILDEPTNGLDPRGRREIHDILLGLAAEGAGILLCTHLLDDVERLCHRVGIIAGGRSVAEGAIAELTAAPGHRARFELRLCGPAPEAGTGPAHLVGRRGDWAVVEIDAAASPADTWRDLIARGWPIAEIRRAGGGLEELYLALTEGEAA
jgi:ABC-2 type transport system ATP-binding protein